jgi:nitroreductase
VPVLVVPCLVARPPAVFSSITCSTLYGSILPAVWSFQLALRSRDLGSVFTTLHLSFEDDARTLLGIPPEALQVALIPVAHLKNPTPRSATRPGVEAVAYLDAWGRPFEEIP